MTTKTNYRIKKSQNGNEYLLTQNNVWVRNFNKDLVPYIDINSSFKDANYGEFYKNEKENEFINSSSIDRESMELENVVIVSDGYDFKNKVQIVKDLPRDVKIIATNGALANWPLTERYPNFYLINNPYMEAMRFFPRKMRVHPTCIASTKTYSEFLKNYRGAIITYNSVDEVYYKCRKAIEPLFQIDDYRNPICAALSICNKFFTSKILLLCCDNSKESFKEGMIKLENNLFHYPQNEIAHNIIDGLCYWFFKNPVKITNIVDHSAGEKYFNIPYIKTEDISSFFST